MRGPSRPILIAINPDSTPGLVVERSKDSDHLPSSKLNEG